MKATYAAMRNSTGSAPAMKMSSFWSNLMPSASDCAQPCQPPTRIGPSRLCIRAATLRSHQIANIAKSETKPTTPTTASTSRVMRNWSSQRT